MNVSSTVNPNPFLQPPERRFSFSDTEGTALSRTQPLAGPYPAPSPVSFQASAHRQPAQNSTPELKQRFKKGVQAAGLLGGAVLLSRFHSNTVLREHLIPTDWKVWAKAGMGIGAVNLTSQAFNWKPPLWLNALGTVAVIHPLIAGFSRQSARKVLVLAPMVAALVQGTSWLSQHAEKTLAEKANIPPVATQLTLSAGMMALGLFGLPPVLKGLTRTGLMGQTAKKELQAVEEVLTGKGQAALSKAKQVATSASSQVAALSTCIRGCCAGSAVCLSELGEFGSAIWTWLTHKENNNKEVNRLS